MRWLDKEYDNMDFSYLLLRQLIGILGILLPFICMFGGKLFTGISIQRSISFYYHTNMRDFFVGLLFLLGLFLITYKGRFRLDNIISTLSGIAALCVALFPCLFQSPEEPVGILQIKNGTSDIIHFTCASTFFILLAFNSLFLFTKRKEGDEYKPHKKTRNIIYIVCGSVILICLITLAIILLFGKTDTDQTITVLVFETIMLIAFGFSWLVKGQTFLKDDDVKGRKEREENLILELWI